MNAQTQEDDSFFDFCLEKDEESLKAIESAIAALQPDGSVDANAVRVDDGASAEFDISGIYKSDFPENPPTEIKETLQNPGIEAARRSLFRSGGQSKPREPRPASECNVREEYESKEFRYGVALPIVLLSEERSAGSFYTALRIVGFAGGEIAQLLRDELVRYCISEQNDNFKNVISALLAEHQAEFLFSFYRSEGEESKNTIIAQVADFLETQNYFDKLQIALSSDVASYSIEHGRFVLNSELAYIYQRREVRPMLSEPLSINITIEAFLFENIRSEVEPQCFCQLLNCLRVYCIYRSFCQEEKRQKFIRMLIAEFSRITSPPQQTSLIVGIFSLLCAGTIEEDILSRVLEVLLEEELSRQSRKSIRMCLEHVQSLPEISELLEKKLIRANYCDFFVYFALTREYLIRELEAGNRGYFPLIDQIIYSADPSASCRLFSSMLVRIRTEKSFLQRLKLAQTMEKLLVNINSRELKAQFNLNTILANVSPQNMEDCRKLFCSFELQDYEFLRRVPAKTALLICQYQQKYGDGDGKQIFARYFTDQRLLNEFG